MRTPGRAGRRLRALAAVAVAGALMTVGALGGSPVAPADDAFAQRGDRPNVVVVMTDDQDVRSLREMPIVRRLLAHRGTTFDNNFATFPLCCPSRASFLTGQYAHNAGVFGNKPPRGGYQAFRNARGTLPIALKRAGYRTGYFGKYLNGYKETTAIPRGWDQWAGMLNGQMFDYDLNVNGRVRSYGSRTRDYQTDVFGRFATRFVRRSAGRSRPFFVTLAPFAVHREGGPRKRQARDNPRPAPRHRREFRNARLPKPPSFNERDVADKPRATQRPRLDRKQIRSIKLGYRARLASLQSVDEAVGDLVQQLRRSGELGNTLFLFTSDNGWMYGEHRLTSKNKFYEESVGAPLVMRGPGIPAGVTRRQITGNIDLAPTILGLTGVRPLREQDGISLLPLARDPASGANRDILFENNKGGAVRTPRYMYAEYRGGDRELYDLQRDPFQLESIHAGGPHARADSRLLEQQLSQRLRQLEDCAGDGCR